MVIAYPISRYLVRFDAEDSPPPSFVFEPEAVADPAELEAMARAAGFGEGFEAGLSAARAEAETAQQAARAAFDVERASERDQWVADEAGRLDEALARGFEALTAEIAHCVDQILRPFLTTAMRGKAVAMLAADLARLGDDAPLMRISGPADLLDALRSAGAFPCGRVELTIDEGTDVTVVAQATLIETRLDAWTRRLADRGEDAVHV